MKKHNLIALSSIALLIVVFMLMYFSLNSVIRADLEHRAIAELNKVAEQKTFALRKFLENRKSNTEGLLHLIRELSLKDKGSLQDLRQSILQDYAYQHDFQNIYVFDTQGELVVNAFESNGVFSNMVGKSLLDNAKATYFKQVISSLNVNVSAIYPTMSELYSAGINDPQLLDKRLIFYIAPLIDDNALKGVVMFSSELSSFDIFEHDNTFFDETGRVVFVESDGEYAYALYSKKQDVLDQQITRRDLTNDVLISNALSGTSGYSNELSFMDTSVVAQWRYIPELKIGMLIMLDKRQVLSLMSVFSTMLVVAAVSLLLVGGFLSWYFSKNFASALISTRHRLFKVVDHQDESNDQNDEIKLLGNAIDMIEMRIEHDNEVLLSAKQRLRFFMKELEDQRFAFDQHCIIVVADADGTFTDANEQFSDISGYARSELIGSSFKRFGGDYQNERIMRDILDSMNAGNIWQGELNLIKRSGERYWLETSFVPFINDDGSLRNMVAIHTDITEQKLAYADMIHQAQYDTLTGLPNRALLMDRLGQLLRNSRRNKSAVTVLFLDLDDFKKVNDTLGHEFGDELLIEVGRRLKGVIREQDTVGRLGGDEFLILLSDMEYREDVEIVARKVIESIRQPISVDEYELVVGVSIGIAMFPDDGDTDSEILRNADSAMYNAKRMGRNAWSYYTHEMNKEVARRLEVESWMNDAIERGEFSVVFQPIVSVNSGKFATVEALVRWTHPQGGSISPDEFIPIAEHSGYIINIGKFVLEKSLDLAEQWKEKFRSDLIVAINASPRQFRDPDWHGGIEEQLANRGLSTRNIEFEITEGVLISGNENVERALQDFSDKGIAISMDDFGTGYSSLSYLRNYPFDTLKIDRSFVADIVEDHGDFELVSAAIAMAHGLGLQVIAEGVETLEQYELLYQRRCDFAQGYLFSKPVSAKDILKMGGTLPSESKIRQQRYQLTHNSGVNQSKSYY